MKDVQLKATGMEYMEFKGRMRAVAFFRWRRLMEDLIATLSYPVDYRVQVIGVGVGFCF